MTYYEVSLLIPVPFQLFTPDFSNELPQATTIATITDDMAMTMWKLQLTYRQPLHTLPDKHTSRNANHSKSVHIDIALLPLGHNPIQVNNMDPASGLYQVLRYTSEQALKQ